MYLLPSSPSTVKVQDIKYQPLLSFSDGKDVIHLIHQGDRYEFIQQIGDRGSLVVKLDSRIVQILHGLPNPLEAGKMPGWQLRTHYAASQACRIDAPVRALFGAYVSLLGQLSRLKGQDSQEVTVLRAAMDQIWPNLTEQEVQQANNLRAILWFSPPKG